MRIMLMHPHWAEEARKCGANLRRATDAEIASADPALHDERRWIASVYGVDRAPEFYVLEARHVVA